MTTPSDVDSITADHNMLDEDLLSTAPKDVIRIISSFLVSNAPRLTEEADYTEYQTAKRRSLAHLENMVGKDSIPSLV